MESYLFDGMRHRNERNGDKSKFHTEADIIFSNCKSIDTAESRNEFQWDKGTTLHINLYRSIYSWMIGKLIIWRRFQQLPWGHVDVSHQHQRRCCKQPRWWRYIALTLTLWPFIWRLPPWTLRAELFLVGVLRLQQVGLVHLHLSDVLFVLVDDVVVLVRLGGRFVRPCLALCVET